MMNLPRPMPPFRHDPECEGGDCDCQMLYDRAVDQRVDEARERDRFDED